MLANIILAVQMLSALAMVGLVLIQHGKGADMGAAFGSGGAGSLFVDEAQTLRVMDSKDFPPEYLPTASNMARAFDLLRASKANWTYLSPSALYDPAGARTGHYTLGKDTLLLNKSGQSYVSYADFALAMIDEIRNKAHVRQRFTVVGEQEV